MSTPLPPLKNPCGCDEYLCRCPCDEDDLWPLSGDTYMCVRCQHDAANQTLRDIVREAEADPLEALKRYAGDIAAQAPPEGAPLLALGEEREVVLRALARLVIYREPRIRAKERAWIEQTFAAIGGEEVRRLRAEVGALWAIFGPIVEGIVEKADNWAGVDHEIEGVRWTISAQRVDGKTPVERLTELAADVERLTRERDEVTAERDDLARQLDAHRRARGDGDPGVGA